MQHVAAANRCFCASIWEAVAQPLEVDNVYEGDFYKGEIRKMDESFHRRADAFRSYVNGFGSGARRADPFGSRLACPVLEQHVIVRSRDPGAPGTRA